MRGRGLAATAILALAACGGQAGTTNAVDVNASAAADAPSHIAMPPSDTSAADNAAVANMAAPVDSSAADEAAVRTAVDKLYAGYNTPDGANYRLSAAFDKAWKRAVGKDGAMDADPFCQCRDFDKVRVKAHKVTLDGDKARDAITFVNFGEDRKVTLGLAREGGTWRFDDIIDDKGGSLKAAMLADKPGSWDIGAQ